MLLKNGYSKKMMIYQKTSSEEIKFVKQNAVQMVESTDALKTWINYIKE